MSANSAVTNDLTQKILPFLDPHLGIQLLSHVSAAGLYADADIAKAQYELASRTDMVDRAIELHKKAFPSESAPESLTSRKEAIAGKGASLSQDAEKVLNVVKEPSVASVLKQDRAQNVAFLQQNHNITTDQIESLYNYGYHLYASGEHSAAATYLYHFSAVSPNSRLHESALWGRLASDALTGEWEKALEDVRLLREHIDGLRSTTSVLVGGSSSELTHEAVLQKRVWLLHWSLFVWANHDAGRAKLVELFLSPAYLSAVQTSCSWLLRYLVYALIATRRTTRTFVIEGASGQSKLSTHAALRELSRTIQSEAHRLQPDPIVDFFRQLYIDLDFKKAVEQLAEAIKLAKADFFIHAHANEFEEGARALVTDVFCRIHQKVQISELSAVLAISPEEGAKWVSAYLADRSDAKIDTAAGVVTFVLPHPNVYQSVTEKTRTVAARTGSLVNTMERHQADDDEADEEADEAEEPAGDAPETTSAPAA
ncbi:eukaryotic translation initiation factor 3 subunit E [Malassezia cuniculi]|uniref:Eukaryotic translation initiation factor 3 subunit E n=1 Tax=Malassezia cuniculi TaxID=948313 RepID=A0AAF0ETE0_9BASI|nr:eukaryotic translation initiation factor 3 subunit E [Malassezia cuniculi]